MGKGRDKRKKREDPSKALKRAAKQSGKLRKAEHKGEGGAEGEEPEGFNNEEAIEVTLRRMEKQDKKVRVVEEVQNVPPPTPRANVVFTAHPERDNELLVFGGEFYNGELTEAYNDLYFYHTKRNSWAKLSAAVKPAPRSSSQGFAYKHYLIIFGGEFVSQTQSQYLHFKDVWRFNSRSSEWEELKFLKNGPSSRSGHRMLLWKRNAVVFGGFYDNAQECRYFNDLWLLSQLEGVGQWTQYRVAPGSDLPNARSGHTMGVHQDTLYLYGGYSTARFNRFKKSEATVHHDLWTIKLLPQNTQPAVPTGEADLDLPIWQKIRLGGVPPPIRCGVSSVFRDRRMYLFGGVVDIESPGGKMVSTFSNDLFVLHMDLERFFPVVLRRKAEKAAGGKKKDDLNDLQAQLQALKLESGKGGAAAKHHTHHDDDDSDSDDDDDDLSDLDFDDGDAASAPAKVGSQQLKESYETNRFGQIRPHRRMDAGLVIQGHMMYVFGGQFELGEKEITMSDLYSLNLNKLETYTILQSQDLSAAVWLGKASEGDANSWESGSTVVSNAFDFDHGDDDDDDEDDEGYGRGGGATVDFGAMPRQQLLDPADDTEEAPEAIPAELATDVTPGHAEIDFLTRVEGKKGLQVHKAQLLAQLGASSAVPTPEKDETFQAFFERTETFWAAIAKESIEGKASVRRVRKEASEFARRRYHEARELLSQLQMVEEREAEEVKFFRERRQQKEREWEEYEQEQEAARAAEASGAKAAREAEAMDVKAALRVKFADNDEYDDEDGSGSGSDSDSDGKESSSSEDDN